MGGAYARHGTLTREGRGVSKRSSYWLLLLPFAATLAPPLYARALPRLFGMPFFYWYQIVQIIVSATIVGIVYVLTREPDHQ